MNRLSIEVVKAGLLAFAALHDDCAQAAPRSATNEQAACAATLKAIRPADPAFDRLDRIYRQSLRFGGTAHRILPHFHATYDDIVAAKNRLSLQDIPFVVFDLARADKANARQTVAIGVLGQFGPAALPCLDAALQDPGVKGRFILTQIKIGIEAREATQATQAPKAGVQ